MAKSLSFEFHFSKKSNYTFKVVLPAILDDNSHNKTFLFLPRYPQNEINKSSKSFRGCISAVFLGDKGPNSKLVDGSPCSQLLIFHKKNCFH